MSIVRSLVILPFLFFALALTACGQAPDGQDNSPSASAAHLLTADEMTTLFLDGAKVWKFASTPGVPIKKIMLRFTEDGKPSDRMVCGPASDYVVTKIIVVIQDLGQDRHTVKLYEETASSKSLSTMDGWFNKPLTTTGNEVQTEVKPITLGTKTLLFGRTDNPVPGQSFSTDSVTAPCRIELVIE